jgi:hypothetical protein
MIDLVNASASTAPVEFMGNIACVAIPTEGHALQAAGRQEHCVTLSGPIAGHERRNAVEINRPAGRASISKQPASLKHTCLLDASQVKAALRWGRMAGEILDVTPQ